MYIRDMLYTAEDVYNVISKLELRKDAKQILLDRIYKKEVILGKIIQLLN